MKEMVNNMLENKKYVLTVEGKKKKYTFSGLETKSMNVKKENTMFLSQSKYNKVQETFIKEQTLKSSQKQYMYAI